ncbi:MAG: hypothetical protein QME49_09170, partial [bacterium]|nr:hypothetical protein [bacterium]
YDADNNLIGDVAGTWTIEGGIGTCTQGYGTSIIFDPTKPGAGTITAARSAASTDGVRTDTTGLITVSLGDLDHIRIEYLNGIEIESRQILIGDTLNLYLRGYDADNNLIEGVSGTWSVEGGLEKCVPVHGTKTCFAPTKPGAGTITVAYGIHTDTTGLIMVSPGAVSYIRIEYLDGTETGGAIQTTTDSIIELYLRGYNANNELIGDIVGNWRVEGSSTSGSGIGTCTQEYGTKTYFDPTTPGTGTIIATDGIHTYTIGLITVRLGILDHIRIEYLDGTEAGATLTTTNDTMELYLRGYDADNNLIGDFAGTWTVEGSLEDCKFKYGTSTIFAPTKSGIGTITATYGEHTDKTGLIIVNLVAVDHIRMEYFDGTPAVATRTTTDNSLQIYIRGYNANNNLIGDIVGIWTVIGGIGNCTPAHGSLTTFDPTTPGIGTITVTDGVHIDTIGSITISLGILDHIRIEYPDGTEVGATQTTTDFTLTLCLRGYDADNNLLGDIAGTWTVSGGSPSGGGIENCMPEYGTSTVFDPTKPGAGTITAARSATSTDGVWTDTTGLITVSVGVIDHIRIEYPDGTEVEATQTTTDSTLTLCLRGYDAENNLIGDIPGTWTVSGGSPSGGGSPSVGGLENCVPGYGSSTVFAPTKPGAGTITVTDGVRTDTTGLITVSLGVLDHIRIEYFDGIEVETTQVTTDAALTLCLRGYDADNNLLGDIPGTWIIEGEIGTCTQGYGTSTIFDPTKPWAGTIIAARSATSTDGVWTDTTGLITVSLGVLDHIRIEYLDGTEAGATQTTTDAALTLCLRGYDADNNLIGDVAGTWTIE